MFKNSKLLFRLYTGFRYLKAKNEKSRYNLIFISLFLGITGGLMVLVVVLGIMNGFQENHISRRIEVGSYHLIIYNKDFKSINYEKAKSLKKLIYSTSKEIQAVIPYADREIILRSKRKYFNEDQVLKLRAVDPDEIVKDKKFMDYFKIAYGDFDLKKDYSIILGVEMFNYILSNINEGVYLTPDLSLGSMKKTGVMFEITGAFKTNSYDYDRFWGYISILNLVPLSRKIELDGIGIKLHNRNKQRQVTKKLKKILKDDYIIQTAEEINKGYLAALRLEKAMVIFLFLMIFLMIAANIFGALKLTILEKKQNISILKALGASPRDIEIIYMIESLVLGFGGSFFGILLGVLLAYNISNIFQFVEILINNIIMYIQYTAESIIPGIEISTIKIYDDTVYYQQGFPVKLNFIELFLICLSVITMTVSASFIPVNKASRLKPIEILKD